MSIIHMSPAEGRLIAASLRADHDLRMRALRGGADVDEDGLDRERLAKDLEEKADRAEHDFVRNVRLDLDPKTRAFLADQLEERTGELLRALRPR